MGPHKGVREEPSGWVTGGEPTISLLLGVQQVEEVLEVHFVKYFDPEYSKHTISHKKRIISNENLGLRQLSR